MNGLRKHTKYIAVIILLMSILGIKFITGNGDDVMDAHHSKSELAIEQYTLNVDGDVDIAPIRNIFAETHKRNIQSTNTNAMSHARQVHVAPKPLPAPQHEVEQQEITDGEFERLKLIGIVFHDNKKKAYLALDRQRVIADVGDLVYGRYLLREIAINSADMFDTKNNQQKTIMVSGK